MMFRLHVTLSLTYRNCHKVLIPNRAALLRGFNSTYSAFKRSFSEKQGNAPDKTPKENIVLISSSHNIYSNLAFETWVYNTYDFTKTAVLMIYQNDPCVVIGRHQNPWTEVNVPMAIQEDIRVARRYSGGGTVYQDLGNMCVSFLTSRAEYDRKANLNFIVDVIKQNYGLDLMVNDRDDIILNNTYKVSGTAAKLDRIKSYHHFTLLLNSDKSKLSEILQSNSIGFKSNATESVKSLVGNLQEAAPGVTYEQLCSHISSAFIKRNIKQGHIQTVDPENQSLFPDVYQTSQDIKDWSWIYGKTPKFKITNRLSKELNGSLYDINSTFIIDKGRIADVLLTNDKEEDFLNAEISANIKQILNGVRFREDDISAGLRTISDSRDIPLDIYEILYSALMSRLK